jgi:hypothetical protein
MKNGQVRIFVVMTLLGCAAMGAAAPRGSVMLAHPASPNETEKRNGWERVRINETCEGCHIEIAAEWRESRHHLAFTNGPFQRSLARESPALKPFCQGCHAPESNSLVAPSNLVAEMGIGCVTCHAPQGPVLAAPGSASAPHALLRTEVFASDQACANCHNFLFPGKSGQAGLHMQRTADEHTPTAEGQTCVSCHLPTENGARPHKSHRFPGGYDETMLKSAVDVRIERQDETHIRVSLQPRNVTHAFPTGDLFRRLAVEVVPDNGVPDGGKTVYLARHFVRGNGMHEVSEDRVFQVEKAIEFDIQPGAVRVRVSYERVGFQRSNDEHDAEVESRVVLAEQRIP